MSAGARAGREAVEPLPGVRLRGLIGSVEELGVRMAAPYGVTLTDAAGRVWRAPHDKLKLVLGTAAPTVTVLVEDVVPPGQDRRAGHTRLAIPSGEGPAHRPPGFI